MPRETQPEPGPRVRPVRLPQASRPLADYAVPIAHFELVVPTGQGEFVASYSETGLAGLSFPQPAGGLRQRQPIQSGWLQQISHWHRQTSRALKMALTGRPPLDLPPLDLSAGTDFQRQVWAALQQIPWGQTASYGDLARGIGRPNAVRAAGGLAAPTPSRCSFPVIAPWRPTGGSADFPAGWIGNEPCWRRKA